jgi:hypothetical protein
MNELFRKYPIHAVIENTTRKLNEQIERLDPNYLLNASGEDLVHSIASEFRFDVPVLDEDGIHISDYREANIEISGGYDIYSDLGGPRHVKGVTISIAVPYSGDRDFFFIQPTSYSYGGETPNEIRVDHDQLVLIYTRTDNNAEAVKVSNQAFLNTLKSNLANNKATADQFNNGLEEQIRRRIQERKKRLQQHSQMAQALGLPIKRREGTPVTYAIPVQRRPPRIERPAASFSKFEQEPSLPPQNTKTSSGS